MMTLKQLTIAFGAAVAGMALAVSAGGEPVSDGPGRAMADGTVYVDVSPDNGNALYTTSANAPGKYSWPEAMEYCDHLDAGGHNDWRVPLQGELNALFTNRAAIGGFEQAQADGADWMWSGIPSGRHNAWGQRFTNGEQMVELKYHSADLRCVRG